MPVNTRSRGYRKKPGVEPPGSPGSMPVSPGVYLPPEEDLPDYSPQEATPSASVAAGVAPPLVDHQALHEAAVQRVEEKAQRKNTIINNLLDAPLPGKVAPANIGFSELSPEDREKGEEQSLQKQLTELIKENHDAENRASRVASGEPAAKPPSESDKTEAQKNLEAAEVRLKASEPKGSALSSAIVTEPEQQHVLAQILKTGEEDNADKKEELSALTAALQESGARNLPIKGPGGGWRQEESAFYPEEDITNVKKGAHNFFEEAKTDTGGTRGKDETVGELTQTIQGSGAGESYYLDNIPEARQLLDQWEKSKGSPQAKKQYQKAKAEAIAMGVDVKGVGDVTHAHPDKQTVTVKADAKGMVDWTEHTLGTEEGSAKAERWGGKFGINTTTTPWCANYASNGLLRRGFKPEELPANPNYVPSYEEWAQEGKHAHVVAGGIADAKPGDLLAFEGEHIGVYVGNGEMISGNSSDAVSRTPAEDGGYSVMVIRPNYKGGTVEIPVEQASVVPTSSPTEGMVVQGEGSLSTAGEDPIVKTAQELLAMQQPTEDQNPGSSLATQLLFGGGENESAADALLNSPLPSIGTPGISGSLSNEDLLKLLLQGRV